MKLHSRRHFLCTATAATLAAAAPHGFASGRSQHVFIGSNTPKGILLYAWDAETGTLSAGGVAAKLANVDWIVLSPDRKYLFAASEVESFNGRRTGAVASYRVDGGAITPLSAQNSAGPGTCHIALGRSGRVLVAADYGGGSAASFKIADGKLTGPVWSEHYAEHGPNPNRQEAAHAHFASFSPDNRFAYVNDLGGDCIHIYRLNTDSAELTAAGRYRTRPGAGPRTLHFHPNGVTAYCMNELNSTVDVLRWNKPDGSLSRETTIELLPPDADKSVTSTGCDTVIARDGRNVYFANRGIDFLYSFKADATTGALTAMARTTSGGRTPRNFTLDPTERWMLVANQNSNAISVFARNPETGALAREGKSFPCPAPMCILFA